MQTSEENQGDGLNPETDARLKAEIKHALNQWNERYGPVRLELALSVFQMLMQNVDEKHGLAAYVEFLEEIGDNCRLTSGAIREVLEQDQNIDQTAERKLH